MSVFHVQNMMTIKIIFLHKFNFFETKIHMCFACQSKPIMHIAGMFLSIYFSVPFGMVETLALPAEKSLDELSLCGFIRQRIVSIMALPGLIFLNVFDLLGPYESL